MPERSRGGLTIRSRLTLTYTALIVVIAAVCLSFVLFILSVLPGFQFTQGAFPRNGATWFSLTTADDIYTLLALAAGIALVIVGAIGAAVSWVVAGRILRPLGGIITTARAIDAEALDLRIPPTGPQDELRDVAETLNEMLDRMQRIVESRSRFAANAAHELRTPLTTNRAIIQLALRETSGQTVQKTFRRLQEVNEDMIRMTSALLLLATIERVDDVEYVDLATITRDVVDDNRMLADRDQVTVTTELHSERVFADPALLRQLVANLVRNSIIHNHRGGSVRVAMAHDESGHALVIANTGQLVRHDEIALLLEPLYRNAGRLSTADRGHGLGLPLTVAIAQAHGWSLGLAPHERGGLIVTVRFDRHSAVQQRATVTGGGDGGN